MNRKNSYENLQKHIRKLKTPRIAVWANQYADREYVVDLTTDEFTCICPKTGLPDFATIHIQYKPGKVCLELKSFKMYLIFYRMVGIFHEHLVNKLLDDCVHACLPRWMRVEVVMKPRGGISTSVYAEYTSKK